MLSPKRCLVKKIIGVAFFLSLAGFIVACSSKEESAVPQEKQNVDGAAATDSSAPPEAVDDIAMPVETEATEKEATEKEATEKEAYVLQLRPYAESPYAQPIDAGLIYLAENYGEKHSLIWLDLLYLDYLQRKFGLDEVFAIKNALDMSRIHEQDMAIYKLFSRIFNPDFTIENAKILARDLPLQSDYKPTDDELLTPAHLKHIEQSVIRILLQALYCDVEQVDDVFIQEILEGPDVVQYKGKPNDIQGFNIIHLAIAYQWLKEREDDEALVKLQGGDEKLVEALEKTVVDQSDVTELALQAMAVLCYTGHTDSVKEEWLKNVVEAQLSNGAWGRSPGAGPSCRATMFALWVLLEKAMPEMNATPWLL